MFSQIKEFFGLHPVIKFLLLGTLVTKAAKSMTTPFLAIYLHQETGEGFGVIGLVIGLGILRLRLEESLEEPFPTESAEKVLCYVPFLFGVLFSFFLASFIQYYGSVC